MRDTETKSFKTTEGLLPVRVVQLPAIPASMLLIKLLDAVGPGLASLATVVDPLGNSINLGALPAGVEKLFSKLTGPVYAELLRELLTEAVVIRKNEQIPLDDAQINTLFKGHTKELFRLFVFAVQENYRDFFDGLGGLAQLAKKVKAMIPTPSPSEGSDTSSGPPNG
jgi:hypothetical protein